MFKFLHENIKSYLTSLVSLDFNPKQNEFFKFELANAKTVKIQSYKSDPKLEAEINAFLKQYKPKQKGCFETAAKCTVYSYTDIEYVEGFVSYMGLPIEHAFNCWNGIYFDLTSEILFDSKMGDEHVQIIKIDRHLLSKYMASTGYYGDMIANYYKYKILKKK